ncbi:MAG TPA: hypothetical protein PKI60_07915 [Oscillospiraceae bacterium]|nr:hypothetical protein [Oscillospiraceae bacterium]
MSYEIFQIAMVAQVIMIGIIVICLVLSVVMFISKLYFYKKMKNDGEEIKIFSKRNMVIGIPLLLAQSIIFVVHIINFLENSYSRLFLMILFAFLPAWLSLSLCLVGNKSMVIGAKRYFYSDIQKIQSESLKYILKTYTITTTDGKVKTYVVMFGSKKLNKELGKYVMMNYEK